MKTTTKIRLSVALFPLVAAMNAHALFNDFEIIDNASSNGGEFFEDVFFGGSFGQASADGFCTSSSDCNNEDTSWKVYGGYTLNKLVDAEVSYQSIGDLSRTAASGTVTSELSALSFNAVGKYDVTETVQAIGKVGAASWSSNNSSGDKSGTSLTYGFGAKVSMNENMKLRAEWENISGVDAGNGDNTINTLSLGVELKTL